MKKTLPEIDVIRNPSHYASRGTKVLKFPDACPCCGAGSVEPGTYSCGAKYSQKPQCQTHTDVWWGSCPGKKVIK